MDPTVKARIALNQDRFTPIENDIAGYVLNNFEDVVNESIASLAEKSSTSEASITRFCRKLGFSGFNKFKIALAQDIYISKKTVLDAEVAGNPVISVVDSYKRLLDNMYSLIDLKELDHLVSLLCSADYVYLICSTKMKVVGMEMESRLDSIGVKSKLLLEYQSMINASFQAKKGELCIFLVENIGVSRYYNLAITFKNNGCSVGLITQFVARGNHNCSDAVLIVVDKLVVQSFVSISNNIMYLLVIDILITELLARDKKYQKRKSLSDSLSANDILSDTIYFTP